MDWTGWFSEMGMRENIACDANRGLRISHLKSGADFKMRENVAAAMYPVGVHNFSCVLVLMKLDTLKP